MTKNISLKILLIILLIIFNAVNSQIRTINGIVLDSQNSPIQYANVGFLNESIGTVTNIKGEFVLNVDNSKTLDSLKISAFGFKSNILIPKDFNLNKNLRIFLRESPFEIKEVIITPNKLKTYSEGKEKTKTNQELFFVVPNMSNVNLGAEIGRKFSLGKKNSKLQEFKFFIKENNFEQVKFRINVYSINKNTPFNRINKSDIFSTIDKNITGWIKVDLANNNIIVNQDIIITIEWIEASKIGNTLSLPIFAPSFNSIHYYKQSAQSKWREYRIISTSMVLSYKQ